MKRIFFLSVLVLVFAFNSVLAMAASQSASVPAPARQQPSSKAEQTEKIVQRGMRGDEVVRLQKLLADTGFYPDDIDGIFGGATLAALKEFQQFCGLRPSGIANEETFKYLERSLGEPSRYSRSLIMKATAYTAEDSGNTSHTSRGHVVRKGLAAVDPLVIPLGTRLFIPGYGYAIADDIGGSIKENTIDLAFETYNEAIQFGVQRVTVYILD